VTKIKKRKKRFYICGCIGTLSFHISYASSPWQIKCGAESSAQRHGTRHRPFVLVLVYIGLLLYTLSAGTRSIARYTTATRAEFECNNLHTHSAAAKFSVGFLKGVHDEGRNARMCERHATATFGYGQKLIHSPFSSIHCDSLTSCTPWRTASIPT